MTFGAIRKRQTAWDGLVAFANALPLGMIAENKQQEAELARELHQIIEQHKKQGTLVPDYVWEEEEFTGATQEIDMARDKQTMQEEENERMMASKIPEDEIGWKMLALSQIKPTPFGHGGNGFMPALYTLNEAMQQRSFTPIFDSALLISENLLCTFRGQANCLVSEDQKPIHHLLITSHHAVLLSEEDAKQLKSLLVTTPTPNCWLVEPNGQLIKNGSSATPWPKAQDPRLQTILLQAMLLQGDALHLVAHTTPLKEWLQTDPALKKAAKELFEEVLTYRTDDAKTYEKSWPLRSCFLLMQDQTRPI